ncbi:MAG: hypothetical protein A3F78_09220 [Burkholderiales bacterium RIFCSPLOWO2_12_FULL_61_40]|nr:MAG: hypothetical protein A3F78_09220 [Burkholderiales bacterium RIFCSPLOWO2_12_FULL_61_40]
MSTETHDQIANAIWSICNLLRGPYKRNEYRKVILPLTEYRHALITSAVTGKIDVRRGNHAEELAA